MSAAPIFKSEAAARRIADLYDGLLARWPVPASATRLPTRHGETFVLSSGAPEAPPLVLLHGSCSNALSWGGEVAAFAAERRVHCVDIIGEPGRSAPARPPLDGPADAEWLADVLDGLGIARTDLVGYSMGGLFAAQLAVARPERIRRLVLMAPAGVTLPRLSFVLAAILGPLPGGRERMKRLLGSGVELPAEAQAIFDAIADGFRPRMRLPNLTDAELRRLTMPVLLLAGARDGVQPADRIAARLRRLVPRLEVQLLPGAGHLLLGVAGRILPFLRAGDGS